MNPNAALIYLATIRLRREQRERIARMRLEAIQKGWEPKGKITKF